MSFRRTDNNDFFDEQRLKYIEPELMKVSDKLLKAARLVPFKTNIPKGTSLYEYRQYEAVGVANFIANHANDYGAVEIKFETFNAKMRMIGSQFEYSIQDLEAAQKAGEDLDSKLADAAKMTIDQKIDKVVFVGDSARNMYGLFNNPNSVEIDAPNDGALGATTFASKTAEQIVRDIQGAINDVWTTTKENEMVNTLVFPTSVVGALVAKTMPNSTTTVLEFIQQKLSLIYGRVEIETSYYLDNLNGDDKAVLFGYVRDPRRVNALFSSVLDVLPTFTDGAIWRTKLKSNIFGVVFYKPLSSFRLIGV